MGGTFEKRIYQFNTEFYMKKETTLNQETPPIANVLLAKVRLSKRETLALIAAEIYSLKSANGRHFDATSHLCSVINTLTKGTRYHEEMVSIIKNVHPEYFNNRG